MTGGPGREKVPVAVLGATGSVGQRLATLLADHPWFEIRAVTASERSAGKRYGDAARWTQSVPVPPRVGELTVTRSDARLEPRLAFSALDASVAGAVERDLAARGHFVISNARNHRMDPGVPLLIPEVNADHLRLLKSPSKGAIVANPNCSTIGLAMALKPLLDAFGISAAAAVTLQAISGAGLPGVSSLEITGNVIPHIPGEEEKMEAETRKILGAFGPGGITPLDVVVSAQCNRVPVVDGHLECVSVSLRRSASEEEIRAAWEAFSGEPQALDLPSAPRRPIHYLEGDRAPQPRLHRDLEGGMAVSIGRLRPDPILDYKFVVLSHNTIRGAAGGALLCAELALARGLLDG